AGIGWMLERASGVGLVIPGGEAGAAVTPTAYRSGPPSDVAADQATESLRQAYERGHRSNDVLYGLAAGLLATDRTDLARDYVEEGRRRFPADYRMQVLAGILAYRSRDFREGERWLEAARQRAPRDPVVLLDLGLVSLESGSNSRAQSLLVAVMDGYPGSPLAQRARRTLTEHSQMPPRHSG